MCDLREGTEHTYEVKGGPVSQSKAPVGQEGLNYFSQRGKQETKHTRKDIGRDTATSSHCCYPPLTGAGLSHPQTGNTTRKGTATEEGVQSQNHKTLAVGRDLKGHPVQPSCQNRVSPRVDHAGMYPDGF